MSEQRCDNPYEANDTMILLGHQDIIGVYTQEARKQMNEIVNARRFTTTRETALDMFMLGFIYGKRAERRRRREKASRGGVV